MSAACSGGFDITGIKPDAAAIRTFTEQSKEVALPAPDFQHLFALQRILAIQRAHEFFDVSLKDFRMMERVLVIGGVGYQARIEHAVVHVTAVRAEREENVSPRGPACFFTRGPEDGIENRKLRQFQNRPHTLHATYRAGDVEGRKT
jgi:hypothetical protein